MAQPKGSRIVEWGVILKEKHGSKDRYMWKGYDVNTAKSVALTCASRNPCFTYQVVLIS